MPSSLVQVLMTFHHIVSIVGYVVTICFNRMHWHCAFLGCCEARARRRRARRRARR
jgi:hypothetical protein